MSVPSEAVAAEVPLLDYWHVSSAPGPVDAGFKEWSHFIIPSDDFHLLINVSLAAGGPNRPDAPLTPRLIVLFADANGAWDGDIERFELDETRIVAGLPDAVLGRNSVRFFDGRYRIEATLPRRDISMGLDLEPVARPLVANSVRLSPSSVMAWTVVPSLRASGTVTVRERHFTIRDQAAYHDRNWGRFPWGGDYGWEWAVILPDDKIQPWTLVYSRFTDRARAATLSQSVLVWRGDSPARKFYGRDLAVTHRGLLRRDKLFRLPRIAALALPGAAADVPRELHLSITGPGDALTVRMCFDDFAQIVVPNDRWPGLTKLSEVCGRAHVEGHIGDERVGFSAHCQAELNDAAG